MAAAAAATAMYLVLPKLYTSLAGAGVSVEKSAGSEQKRSFPIVLPKQDVHSSAESSCRRDFCEDYLPTLPALPPHRGTLFSLSVLFWLVGTSVAVATYVIATSTMSPLEVVS